MSRAALTTIFALTLPLCAVFGCADDSSGGDPNEACADWARISNFMEPCPPNVGPQSLAGDAGVCAATDAGDASDAAECPQ